MRLIACNPHRARHKTLETIAAVSDDPIVELPPVAIDQAGPSWEPV